MIIDNNAFDQIVSRGQGSTNIISTTSATLPVAYNPMNPPPPGLETNKQVYGTSLAPEP